MNRLPAFGPAAALAFLCAVPAAPALTLRQAQDILFRDNPDLAILKLETERSESQVDEARAAWLPSVDALGNYGYTSEVSRLKLDLPFPPPAGTSIDRPIGDHDKMEAGVDATWPLFTGFARGRNVEAKRAGAKAKDAQWRGARNQMSLKLAALYYAWQLAGSQAAYQEKVLDYSRELEKQLQGFVKAGTAVRSRALSAEARSKASEVELLALQNTRDSLAFEVLDFLGGRDTASLGSPADLAPDTAAVPEPAWEAVPASAGERPEAEALDLTAAQARLGALALAGQKWPQVFGMAGWRYANPGLNLAGDEFMGYGLMGLQLKWNLFDGSRNRAQRAQLDIQAKVIGEQKRKLEHEWRKAMLTSRLQFSRWTAQYQAASASREAARASAADLKRQFEAGVATGVEWLDARNNEARAEMMMEQARTMQRIALLQWDYAAGKELRF
jgi:outer membrane protein TolC